MSKKKEFLLGELRVGVCSLFVLIEKSFLGCEALKKPAKTTIRILDMYECWFETAVLTWGKTASAIFQKVWAAVKQHSTIESEWGTVSKFSAI